MGTFMLGDGDLFGQCPEPWGMHSCLFSVKEWLCLTCGQHLGMPFNKRPS